MLTRTPATITVLVISVSISLSGWEEGKVEEEEEEKGKKEAAKSHLKKWKEYNWAKRSGNTFTFFIFYFSIVSLLPRDDRAATAGDAATTAGGFD